MKQPHCGICGRFAAALRDHNGEIMRDKDGNVYVWVYRCVGWD